MKAAAPSSNRAGDIWSRTMDEIYKIEPNGKRSKRRWNVWRYRVIGKGLEEKIAMHPENQNPFHSSQEAIAFLKLVAPNQR
jgi:hypothetical protein